ncbi:MAG: ArnT family glycosyltransferase [Acidimicrobiia bacterium]
MPSNPADGSHHRGSVRTAGQDTSAHTSRSPHAADASGNGRPPASGPDNSRFVPGVLLITAGALVLRWVFTYVARGDQPLGRLTDNRWYFEAGRMLASGDGFGNPLIWYSQDHRYVPTAGHPPVYPMLLGVGSFLGIDTPLGARLLTCVLGALTVLVVGYVARDLAGDRAGLVAAGLAAVYPNLWINDATLLSETPYALFVSLFLLAAVRCWRRPTYGRVALLSGWIAIAALTRSEALVLYPFCVLPLLMRLHGLSWSLRFRRLALAALVAIVIVGPWVAYNNQPGRFAEPVAIVGGSGIAMSYGNCDAAYDGPLLGFWSWDCGLGSLPDTEDESVIDTAARDQATSYIRSHLREQPKVITARVGRLFHVYRPMQSIQFDDVLERRGLWPSRLALALYYPITLLGIGGAVVLWRRKLPVSPFVAVALTAVMAAASTFGITRYRVAFDVAATVLAGVAIDALLRAWRNRAELNARPGSAPGRLAADAATARASAPPRSS